MESTNTTSALDSPEVIMKKVNLDVTVNAEGLTIQDLLITFIKEANKQNYLVTGIIVGDAHTHPEMFGNISLKAMKPMFALGYNILAGNTKAEVVDTIISGVSS
jgi:hypothetical protein